MTTKLFSCFLLVFMCCVNPESVPNSGAFKTSIFSIKDCSNPSKPYMKNPPVVFMATIMNNSTISGNITFLKDTKNMKIKLRSFTLHNGKWKQGYLLSNLNCHGMVLHVISVTMKIKYDRNNCVYSKGSYIFENLDVNQLLHLWVTSVPYGQILWRSETYLQAGTFFCKEFDTSIEPA